MLGMRIVYPVFFEEDYNGKLHMLFIGQFAQSKNMQQGLYLHQTSESQETDTNGFNVRVKVGSRLIQRTRLSRELNTNSSMRQYMKQNTSCRTHCGEQVLMEQ